MPWTAGTTAIALVLAIAVAAALAFGPSAGALDCEGVALDDGCLFTITGGDTADPDDGFAVTNANDVPLWDFVRQRDLQALGYPISQRWVRGPFTFQAFQKVILQWDPGKARMNYYNTLDVLANRYPWVELPNVPSHQVLEADRGADFATITRNHLALLDQNPAIKERYLSEPDWLNLYGLPISYEEREVNGDPQDLQMLRAQRTVFVIWNVPAPGTTVGRVNLQNLPDKVKKLRNVIIPDAAKAPITQDAVAELPMLSLPTPHQTGDPTTNLLPTVQQLAQGNSRLQHFLYRMPWLAHYVLPRLADGIADHDFRALEKLAHVAQRNQQVAAFIASTRWFARDENYDQYTRNSRDQEFTMSMVLEIGEQSQKLLDIVLSYTWLADDIVASDGWTVANLRNLARQDLDLALRLAQAPWIVDGFRNLEIFATSALLDLSKSDPILARRLLAYSMHPPIWDSDIIFIRSISYLRKEHPDRYHKLVNQHWYSDGLTLE